MKSYEWWKSQKRRVQKKYTLLCSCYLSPKETKQLVKRLSDIRRKKHKRVYNAAILASRNIRKIGG